MRWVNMAVIIIFAVATPIFLRCGISKPLRSQLQDQRTARTLNRNHLSTWHGHRRQPMALMRRAFAGVRST